jgi:hypothetical protein
MEHLPANDELQLGDFTIRLATLKALQRYIKGRIKAVQATQEFAFGMRSGVDGGRGFELSRNAVDRAQDLIDWDNDISAQISELELEV